MSPADGGGGGGVPSAGWHPVGIVAHGARRLPTAGARPWRHAGVLEHVKALASSTMRVAITGSSGLIGSALRARLSRQGHDVVPVVRRAATRGEIAWDPEHGTLDPADLAGIDAVVNLAGAGIAGRRWTDSYKRQILDSRTRTTSLISQAIAGADERAAGAAVGIGHRLLRRSGRHDGRRVVGGRHRLPRRGLRGMGGEHRRGRRGGRARRPSAHEHGAVGEGRCAAQDAAAVQARPRRPNRQRQAVGELDLDRRRGRRDRAPAEQRSVRTGQPRRRPTR